ncbi:rhodanese-like domain protein [Striga asiatica]|uniref:Rhodanese-like domain protein n=1 Tax=Striga asiatica TaxID=4170 RepID=A0A5A7NZB7_STRAF|nr:rhodanese-like domain protein [Striga asiatica]
MYSSAEALAVRSPRLGEISGLWRPDGHEQGLASTRGFCPRWLERRLLSSGSPNKGSVLEQEVSVSRLQVRENGLQVRENGAEVLLVANGNLWDGRLFAEASLGGRSSRLPGDERRASCDGDEEGSAGVLASPRRWQKLGRRRKKVVDFSRRRWPPANDLKRKGDF